MTSESPQFYLNAIETFTSFREIDLHLTSICNSGLNSRETPPPPPHHKDRDNSKVSTAVFKAEPQKEPERKDFGPGHLQFLDEQAEQERLGGESQAVQGLTARREEEHPCVVLAPQEGACERHVVQFLQELA